MSTIESKDVDVESYPLKNMNSIVLRADGNDEDHHVQITVDSKLVRYLDEAELAHFGKRQQLKVSLMPPKKIQLLFLLSSSLSLSLSLKSQYIF